LYLMGERIREGENGFGWEGRDKARRERSDL
jgi:hypothetical protein